MDTRVEMPAGRLEKEPPMFTFDSQMVLEKKDEIKANLVSVSHRISITADSPGTASERRGFIDMVRFVLGEDTFFIGGPIIDIPIHEESNQVFKNRISDQGNLIKDKLNNHEFQKRIRSTYEQIVQLRKEAGIEQRY